MKERYFSHDVNARIDPKLIKIRRKYGMEGYGIYFSLLEMMCGEPENALPYNNDQFDAISYDLHTDVDIGCFIEDCLEVGLFDTDHNEFWSPSFRRRMSEMLTKAEERSKRAVEAARARWSRKGEKTIVGDETTREPPLKDAGWMRFIEAYEGKIGMIPNNKLQQLSDYHDALGTDIMLLALEQTVKANPDRPAPFLIAILQRWIEDGVDTAQKAKAAILDHDRSVAQMTGRSNEQKTAPADVGRFY